MKKKPDAIVLFDGVCNLCNGSVQFIIDRDPKAYFSFASIQSVEGQKILRQYHLNEYFGSIVLIHKEKPYLKSSAALHICKNLKGFWKIFYVFSIIPAPIRDFAYNYIAKHRYQWFGKRDSCKLPSPELRQRFLE